jgi:hypothetical protein
MARFHTQIDVTTGVQTQVPYTPEEEAAADSYVAPTEAEVDQKALNDALTAPGSVTRAMGELLFKIMKGTEAIPQPSLTKNQFVQKLKALMRNGS